VDAAAVIVGDEILAGHVHDANTYFIAGRLAELGHRMRRAVVVADDPEAIANEVRRARAEASIVFVCGGLGTTHDDRTMEGVALAVGRGLEPCAPLAAMIESLIDSAAEAGFDGSLGSDALRKMALAPSGAELLETTWRFVPAVVIDDPPATIVVLPGPPSQVERVFAEAVEPRYLDGTGEVPSRHEFTHAFPESTFADVLERAARAHPSVSIGSYPQADHTLIRISGPQADARSAAERIRAAIDELAGSERGRAFLAFVRARRGG